jgi:hypothetical protein
LGGNGRGWMWPEMGENLEDRFFDLLLRTLNYSIEFVNDTSYASLRFMDLFTSLLKLQPLMKEISRKEFYETVREKIKDRELVRDPKERSRLQTELSQMFIEEWRRRASQK